jgi:hypothetical protein
VVAAVLAAGSEKAAAHSLVRYGSRSSRFGLTAGVLWTETASGCHEAVVGVEGVDILPSAR